MRNHQSTATYAKNSSNLYKNTYIDTWSTRNSHGRLVREHQTEVIALIKATWKNPSTPKLKCLLECLNDTGRKELNSNKEWKHLTCTRCTRGAQDTIFHRQVSCPAIAATLNRADAENWAIMGKNMEIYREGTTPLETHVNNCYTNLTKQKTTIKGAQEYKHENTWYITTPEQMKHLIRRIISTNWRTLKTSQAEEKDDTEQQKKDHLLNCSLIQSWGTTEAMITNLQKTHLTMAQICNITEGALKKQATNPFTNREEWQTCKDIYDIIFAHLHTEKIRNSGPLDDSHETGTTLPEKCTFVWINPTSKTYTKTYMEEALTTVRTQKEATRYVMLTNEHQNPKEGLRLLATIPPNLINLWYRTPLNPIITPQKMSHTNKVTYYVYIIENKQASTRQINMTSLSIDLKNISPSIILTPPNPTGPKTTNYQGWTLNHRNSYKIRPSLFWYRDETTFRPIQGKELEETSPTNEKTLLAGALGLNLKRIKYKLHTVGHTDADTTPEKLDKIQTNMRNTALEIHREYQNWLNRAPLDT